MEIPQVREPLVQYAVRIPKETKEKLRELGTSRQVSEFLRQVIQDAVDKIAKKKACPK